MNLIFTTIDYKQIFELTKFKKVVKFFPKTLLFFQAIINYK
jgi:hypothetical protein